MSNKLSATFHPHTAPTLDEPSCLDLMEAEGANYDDVHGMHKGFIVAFVLLVGFWAGLGGYIVWAVTR